MSLQDHPRPETLDPTQRADFFEAVPEQDKGKVHDCVPGDEDLSVRKEDSNRIRSMSRYVNELNFDSIQVKRNPPVQHVIR